MRDACLTLSGKSEGKGTEFCLHTQDTKDVSAQGDVLSPDTGLRAESHQHVSKTISALVDASLRALRSLPVAVRSRESENMSSLPSYFRTKAMHG